MVHIYDGILLSHKNKWNYAICRNMDGPRDYHTTWNKSDKERQIYDTLNLFTKQKQTHRYWKQTYGYQSGKVGGGIN